MAKITIGYIVASNVRMSRIERIQKEIKSSLTGNIIVVTASTSGYRPMVKTRVSDQLRSHFFRKHHKLAIFDNPTGENVIAWSAVQFAKNNPKVIVIYSGRAKDEDITQPVELPNNLIPTLGKNINSLIALCVAITHQSAKSKRRLK